MSIFYDQWIGVSHPEKKGRSFIRLIDIERVSLSVTSIDDNNESHVISVLVKGLEYIYDTKKGYSEAENTALEIINSIEKAHGRIEDNYLDNAMATMNNMMKNN